MDLPRLLLLTDRSQLRLGRGLVRTVAECVAAGGTHWVVRELDEPESARSALVAALVDVGATVISARTLLPGAVGVQLPACRQAGTVSSARTSCLPAGRDRMWGRSCHSRDEVAAAARAGAAYATLSPYAASDSKPGYGPPLPATAYAGHPIPVFALGGIGPDNAGAARAAGAHGVAVMGAVMRAQHPAAEVRALLEAVA